MSDECEMFGECMLESLVARPRARRPRSAAAKLALGAAAFLAAIAPLALFSLAAVSGNARSAQPRALAMETPDAVSVQVEARLKKVASLR